MTVRPPAAETGQREDMPDEMGVHDDCGGTIWLPRTLYPTRDAARRWWCDFTGNHWLDARVLSRWMRYAPDLAEFGEPCWAECERDVPGAFRVWRCE